MKINLKGRVGTDSSLSGMWLFLLWIQIGRSLATVADISSELHKKFATSNSVWEDL